MGYRTHLVKIGNSQGIRIPRPLLEQAGLNTEENVELLVEGDRLIIQPIAEPRRGWEEAFERMAQSGDDILIDPDIGTEWDEAEWEW
jgi:antitoxin MazE